MENVQELIQSELKTLNANLEKAYPEFDPELIIYGDTSWLITFNDGETTIGENIEELYNFIENSLDI